MEGQLITAVYNRRAIWDPSDELRKNSRILKSLWAEVAQEVGIGVNVAKNRWKNLRAYFVFQLRELGKVKSGNGGCTKTTSSWAFYNQLLFLKDVLVSSDCSREDCLAPTNASEFFDQTQADDSRDDFDVDSFQDSSISEVSREKDTSVLADEPVASTSLSELNDKPAHKTNENNSQTGKKMAFYNRRLNINKRKLKSRSEETMSRELLDIERRKVKLLEREIIAEENPDLLFFKSLLPYMQVFTPAQKLRLRSTIQVLILEEYEAMQQGSDTFRCVTNKAAGLTAPYQQSQHSCPSSASSVSGDSAQYQASSTPSSAPQSTHTNFRVSRDRMGPTVVQGTEMYCQLDIKDEDTSNEGCEKYKFNPAGYSVDHETHVYFDNTEVKVSELDLKQK